MGVAIATALMPPLAVVGYGIAVANWDIAGGAFFLFMTNLLAIALSVTIVARWYGFGGSDTPKQTALQAMLIVGCFALLSVPLGLALKEDRVAVADRTGRAHDAGREGEGRRRARVRAASGYRRQWRGGGSGGAGAGHIAGVDALLQKELGARLGHPVSVRVQEKC